MQTSFENALIEHELDYVLIGSSNQNPHINQDEVADYKWASISDIKTDIISNPNQYTSWFKIALERVF